MSKIFIGINALASCYFIKSYVLTVARVRDDSLEPIVKKGSWLLVSKWWIPDSSHLVYFYSPKEFVYDFRFKIAEENQWVIDKPSNFLIKVSKNNIAVDDTKTHLTNLVNKSFVEGVAVYNLSAFSTLLGKNFSDKIDPSLFKIKNYNDFN